MSGKQSAATEKGLALIAEGKPLRTAAQEAGVSPSTLVRARKRAGLDPLKPGRPGKTPNGSINATGTAQP